MQLTYEHLEEALAFFSSPKFNPDEILLRLNIAPKNKPPHYIVVAWHEVAKLASNTLNRDRDNSAKFEILKVEMKKYGLGSFYSTVFPGEVL